MVSRVSWRTPHSYRGDGSSVGEGVVAMRVPSQGHSRGRARIDHREFKPIALRLATDQPPVAEYVWHPRVPTALVPRPYLHPVRTLGGTTVTELMPSSHRQHLGVSLAIADISGTNFWGGRTFLPGRGSTWLDNHGIQRHVEWRDRAIGEIGHNLLWMSYDGTPLLREERTLVAYPLQGNCWALTFTFRLISIVERILTVTSPAVLGRAGAGYGGFFWRAPTTSTEVRAFGPDDEGPQPLNGRHTLWLALTGMSIDRSPWTLVFVATSVGGDPWFVRTRDYPGAGSSLAASQELPILPGECITRRVDTVVADGTRSAAEASAWAKAIMESSP